MPQVFVLPRQIALDDDANPLAGALLYFFATGTTTAQAVYSDAALTTPITQPVVADAAGEFPKIYLNPDAAANYRVRLTTSDGVQLYQEDDIDRFTVSQAEIARAIYPRTAAETSAGVTPTNYAIPSHDAVGYVMPVRYGLVNDGGLSDQTAILSAAYSVAATVRRALHLPPWTIKFTSALAWNQAVDVIGDSDEFTVLSKVGNFNGITISGAGQQSRYMNFTVNSPDASDTTGEGIVVSDAAHLWMDKVSVTNHGGRGIHLAGSGPTGFFAKYTNIRCEGNGGAGFHVSGAHFASWFDNIDSRGNTGLGFSISSPAAYHNGKNVIVQQNTAGGASIGGQQCTLEIYAEANTGADITLTVDSVRCNISVLHIDTYPTDYVDLGTNNQGASISGQAAYFSPAFTRPTRTTNAVGLDVTYSAGHAGAGASPFKGGTANLNGGDAAGTGNSDGGDVKIRGGAGIGTGKEGALIIQQGGGLTVIGAAAATTANAVLELQSTTKLFRPPKMTTAQRTAISLVSNDAGGMVYDTDLDKLYVVNNALSWVAQT